MQIATRARVTVPEVPQHVPGPPSALASRDFSNATTSLQPAYNPCVCGVCVCVCCLTYISLLVPRALRVSLPAMQRLGMFAARGAFGLGEGGICLTSFSSWGHVPPLVLVTGTSTSILVGILAIRWRKADGWLGLRASS